MQTTLPEQRIFLGAKYANSLLCLSLVFLWLQAASVSASRAAPGPKQYIFSRSSNQTSSNILGFTGVPAYVNFPDRTQKCGIYVCRINSDSAASLMGLLPGTVLLTVDNQVAGSPASLDSLLKGRTSRFNYTFVKMVNGTPLVVASYIALSGSGQSPSAPTSSLASSNASNKKTQDNTPVSSLESYMVTLVNEDRAKNGHLPALSSNARLDDLARHYAEYLLSTGKLSHIDASGHNPMDRAQAAGIITSIRENLAGQGRQRSDREHVAAAEQQMMSEPDNVPNHRTNILWPEGKTVGVGIARNASILIMVQEFSDRNP